MGRDVQPGTVRVRMPSLISIGDGASLGAGVYFENARVERGELVLGRIDIGAEQYLVHSVLEGNTCRCGSQAGGFSLLADGQYIPMAKNGWEVPRPRWVWHDRSHCCCVRISRTCAQRLKPCFFFVASLSVALLFFMTLFPRSSCWITGLARWQRFRQFFPDGCAIWRISGIPSSVILTGLRRCCRPRCAGWPFRALIRAATRCMEVLQ